jgi:HTH-type transcriptional regulator / antitoxin HigA
MRKLRTLDEFVEQYFRDHPDEIDEYLAEIFRDYAEDSDSEALLVSLRYLVPIVSIR